jgi:sugar phosphate isomerase/epimerase
MQLLPIRHLWGVNEPYAIAFPQFKQAGYAGIEASLIYSAEPREKFISLLNEFDLKWVPMIFTEGKSVSEHLASFAKQIREVALAKPLLINAHSGRDAFSREEALLFYQEALKIENDFGIPIAHETHRSRVFYNPWITRDILLQLPDLKICCDYSHWVVVCERLIDEEKEILQLCAERCLHMHARVGYEQGPQVPDPRAPEYQLQVDAHERWWDIIWTAQYKAQRAFSTFTPEFGPSPYLQTMPNTNTPLASLDEICLWQMQRQVLRFSTLLSRDLSAGSSQT